MSQADKAASQSTAKPRFRAGGLIVVSLCALVVVAVIVLRSDPPKSPPVAASAVDVVPVEGGDNAIATASHPAEPALSPTVTPAVTEAPAPLLFQQSVIREGISVEFAIQHLDPAKRETDFVREGDDVRIRFKINDTASGTPVPSIYPAAWMDLIPEGEIPNVNNCTEKAKALISGGIFTRAELDLNVYHVMTLNDEPSISVVDPLFDFGGTQMLAMIVLESPGEDWVRSADGSRIYVSMPASNKVAAVKTGSWEIVENVEVGPRPTRLGLQPDGAFLWVTDDGQGDRGSRASGITVVDTDRLTAVAHIPTGEGRHDLAFSHDSRWVFVTNEQAGTVSIIDTKSRQKVKDLPVGKLPARVAYSSLAKMAYVTSRGDGTITVVDGGRQKVVTRIKAEPGLGQIRFAPGDRLGFVVNPIANVVHILDPASNRIVQTADVDGKPYQVCFSDELAYIRQLDTATVVMMPLRTLGVEGRPVEIVEFPGGESPPVKGTRLSPADAIVQAPGASAVLVANPLDKAVYFYKEGMAAAMGNFSNYGRQPRAVMVVDRSLRERRTSGVYETVARLRTPGKYDVVFFLDAPRVVHCFTAEVQPNPELEAKRLTGKIKIEHLTAQRRVDVGQNVQLKFRLSDHNSGQPLVGLEDVQVLTNLMPGIWHRRHAATATAEDGVYALDFAPPRPGIYYVYLQSLSRRLSFSNAQFLVLEAIKPSDPPASVEKEKVADAPTQDAPTKETADVPENASP